MQRWCCSEQESFTLQLVTNSCSRCCSAMMAFAWHKARLMALTTWCLSRRLAAICGRLQKSTPSDARAQAFKLQHHSSTTLRVCQAVAAHSSLAQEIKHGQALIEKPHALGKRLHGWDAKSCANGTTKAPCITAHIDAHPANACRRLLSQIEVCTI